MFGKKLLNKFFDSHLDFRVRAFNVIAGVGSIISLIMCVVSFLSSAGLTDLLLCAACLITAATLLWYAGVSGRYQLCSVITIVVVFLIYFPMLFFATGGYHSGMPSFFIIATTFTVLLLEGKKLVVMFALELAVYTSLFLWAYYHPEHITFFETERGVFIDTFAAFLVVSALLGITMSLHSGIYIRQQRKLEAAYRQVEELSRMKSELFAAVSHEMRTPLTVMSAYAQYAVEQVKETGITDQTLADFNTISGEAKRLAEMADGTLKILMPASGADGTGGQQNTRVDIGVLAERIARLLKPVAAKKGMALSVCIKDGNVPPVIKGDADALTQLLWNILQNAIVHSHGERIVLNVCADSAGAGAVITVEDDGKGIPPDMLPQIFERGVSGSAGGNGIGLSVCREIVRRHGGEIVVDSEVGKGTVVTVSLCR